MAAKTTSSSTPGDFTGFARKAFAPASRFNELAIGNVERVVRFQYELTGELLQFGLDQLNATVNAKDLPTLFARQREIATRFYETATQRQQALADLASESQAGFAKWLEDATSLPASKAA